VLHVPQDFSTIQAAVDAASPRDIIQVAQGTYNENVLIEGKSDIQLRGKNTVLQGSGVGTGIRIVGSDHIEVQGFIVDGYGAGIVLDDTHYSRLHDIETRFNDDPADVFPEALTHDGLQLIDSDHNLISDVFAHHNGHNGITLAGGSSNNTLRWNTSNDNGTNPNIPTFGCGIELRNDGNNNNSITENELLRNGWGILLGFEGGLGADDNIIEENDIHDNARTGIDVKDGSSGNFMIENDATGNAVVDDDFSPAFDLNDGGPLDNTWEDNEGTSNF